ncbi:MAG: chain-length determining protein [Gammaproteobacteria bacterium]|nr:chain-length determining protein [Gammaproteobacteria bacterium]
MNQLLAQIYGYMRSLWRYRWSALAITWLVAVIGWLYVFSLPDRYKAEAVVYVDTTSVMQPLLRGLAPETDTGDELAIMSRVLLSRENLMSVIRETGMDLEVATADEKGQLVESLAGSIMVTVDDAGRSTNSRSNIYEISYQSGSAERAYEVVSNLLNTMIVNTWSATRTDAATAEKFLDSQIAEYEQRLTGAEQRLADFKKANVGLMPDEKGSYYTRLQRAQEEVEQTQSALRLAEQRARQLTTQLQGERPVLGSKSSQSATSKKLRAYQEELGNLLNQYTERHPDVQVLKEAIAALQADLRSANQQARSVATGESVEFNPVYQQIKVEQSKANIEVETLKIQLGEQQANLDKLKNSIDVIPEVESRLAKLNRDYEVTRGRYLDLVERRESAKLAQNAGLSASDVTFRVIEPPVLPTRPSGPPRMTFLAGVLAVAVGAGVAWSFLRHLWMPTYISPHQLRRSLGLPVLGSVSLYLSPQQKYKRRLQLISFLTVAILLVLSSGGVIWYSHLGTTNIISSTSDLSL